MERKLSQLSTNECCRPAQQASICEMGVNQYGYHFNCMEFVQRHVITEVLSERTDPQISHYVLCK